jgi:DNA segregation ATPase FtsK/SpoIIIE-like protein
MKLELWIYDDKKYKICELPEYEKGEYLVQISENEKVLLECRKEEWYFPKETCDEIKRLNHQIFEDRQLRREDLWEYRRKEGKKVAILVFLKQQKLQSYQYYHLDETKEYLIGSGAECDIRYNVAGMISKKHGVIKEEQGRWYLIDCSKNGIYEKGGRISPRKRMQYGESFSIFGLHLIFLEGVLAIGCRNHEKLKMDLTEVIESQNARTDMMVTPHVKMLEQLRNMQKDREERYKESVDFVLFSCMMKTELDTILQNWRKNNCRDGIKAQIGVTEQGKVCELDLQEWADGPHGMIAGMTGAGKSQCMQSIFLSLAIRYSPEQLQFVLIDYKGGGMAEQFAAFPHVAGVLTNLEGNLLHRGICAMKSEIKRREQRLSREQVNHIDDYNAITRNEKLPHLCIMIDEFAELKSQLPVFAETIVQVSRVGRSLGLHVILSTQKPSGEIENILLANSGFRICFKLKDKEQCNRMMGKMLSWAQKPAGRGFLIDGKEMEVTEFQGAYTGHKQQVVSKGKKKTSWDKSREEQVCFVQNRVYKALRKEKICSAVPLWMPPLPDVLKPDNLQLPTKSIVMGLCDETEKQKQSYYVINPKGNGNLVLAGKEGSGKTTFLVGFVSQCIKLFDPSKCWLYLVDFDYGLLSEFSTVPHVGGAVTSIEELKRCISLLERELRKRKDSQGKLKCEADKATILLIIDNMTKLREKAEETLLERIYIILREGNVYGIYIILTAGGFGQREIPSVWRKYLPEKIALNMNNEEMCSFFGEEVKVAELI